MNQTQIEKLELITKEIVQTLIEKDAAYKSSWKAHGGFSAFFNLDRKWSRVDAMSEECQYDIFAAMEQFADGTDTLKDLVGYALLTLTETYDPPNYRAIEVEETMPPKKLDLDLSGDAGPEYVDQDREK